MFVAAVLAIRDLRQCSGATSRRRNETNPFSTTDPYAAGWEMVGFSILSCGSGKADPPHRYIDKRTLQHWWREKGYCLQKNIFSSFLYSFRILSPKKSPILNRDLCTDISSIVESGLEK